MGIRKEKERPGIVFYFDMIPALERMTAEQSGEFLLACLRYAKYGEIPEFASERQQIIWEMTQPRIDADGERWHDKLLQAKYAGYSSAEKRQGREPIAFDDWLDWREHLSTIENSATFADSG